MGVVIIPRNYWSIRLSGCFLSYMMQLALLDMAKAATGQSQSNNNKENQKNQCTRVGHIFSQTLENLTSWMTSFTMSCRVMTPWFNYLNSLFLWIVGRLTSTFLVCWWNHSSCKMRTQMTTIFLIGAADAIVEILGLTIVKQIVGFATNAARDQINFLLCSGDKVAEKVFSSN